MNAVSTHLRRLAHYEIIEPLSTIGAVSLYRAMDTSSRRPATLKTIPRDLNDHEVAATIARFREQARVSANLKHPGILEVYEYGEDGNLAFIASELVEGCSLGPRL